MSEYGKIHTDGSRSGGQPVGDPLTCRACAQNRGTILQLKRELADFKQEVSDAMLFIATTYPMPAVDFSRFIIPKPKPDPLLGIVEWLGGPVWGTREEYVKEIHKALDARGWEIREKGQ